VDERHLSAGEAAYAAGDWQRAALEFMAAVHGGPSEGAGHALHQAGNALVKLGRYADAVTVYQKAVRDVEYPKRGAVFANMGAAFSAIGSFEDALDSYGNALLVPEYATPYKAMLGRAGALYALGRFEDAAQAYRQAAWADGNPDPGKALNNLGLSFMSLNRPEDAVEAFKAALGIEGYSSKGKASANLGLAYAAMGFFEDSVREFESARDEFGYELIGSTLETYEAALVRARTEDTGPLNGAAGAASADAEGVTGPIYDDASSEGSPETTGAILLLPDADDESAQRFFTMTEDDMRTVDRQVRKKDREQKRTPKFLWTRIGLTLAVVLLVGGGLFGAFYLGYGYPTQEQTVTGLLDAYHAGSPTYTDYWVGAPSADVATEMRRLPATFTGFAIEGVDRSAVDSTVAVSVSRENGGPQRFLFLLEREGVGWKVVGVTEGRPSLAQ
jgi:tetratricopeptide (TPR) repeat protein